MVLHYFIESVFTVRDYHRFGVEYFINKRLKVIVWDFTKFLRPQLVANHKAPDIYHYRNTISIKNQSEFDTKWVIIRKNDCVINLLSITAESQIIFKRLNSSHIIYYVLRLGVLPMFRETIFNRIKYKLKLSVKFTHRKLKQGIIPNHFKPTYAVTGGEIAESRVKFIKGIKIIKAHSFDYELYLKSISSKDESPPKGSYALFIDEFLPYHPDYIVRNKTPDVSAENYYPDLISFFKALEYDMETKLIIAAHPRSNYSQIHSPYGNFETIQGNTCELVKHSKLVITHASTAISFAVLYNKPLLFLTSSKYSRGLRKTIINYAKLFNCTPVNLTRLPKSRLNISTDIDAYLNYKNNYIKSEKSPQVSLYDTIYSSLNSLTRSNY